VCHIKGEHKATKKTFFRKWRIKKKFPESDLPCFFVIFLKIQFEKAEKKYAPKKIFGFSFCLEKREKAFQKTKYIME
jgi:hypothetical protein